MILNSKVFGFHIQIHTLCLLKSRWKCMNYTSQRYWWHNDIDIWNFRITQKDDWCNNTTVPLHKLSKYCPDVTLNWAWQLMVQTVSIFVRPCRDHRWWTKWPTNWHQKFSCIWLIQSKLFITIWHHQQKGMSNLTRFILAKFHYGINPEMWDHRIVSYFSTKMFMMYCILYGSVFWCKDWVEM